jgi:hypothetical protein
MEHVWLEIWALVLKTVACGVAVWQVIWPAARSRHKKRRARRSGLAVDLYSAGRKPEI